MKDSLNYYLKLNKEDLYLACPFFESFEGLIAVRIPKPAVDQLAILKLMVSPEFKTDFEKLLDGLKRSLNFELVASTD
jgi:hypothetical protein